MELLLLLLTSHFISDFYLQPLGWVACRNTHHIKSKGLRMHIATHTFLNLLVFLIADFSIMQSAISILVISVSHFLTDLWKSHQKNNLSYFLADQFVHILIICLVSAALSNLTLSQLVNFAGNVLTTQNMILSMAYLLVCKPASVVISLALKKHTDALTNDAKNHNDEDVGLVSAGAWIGYIERCLTLAFIFMGQFAGIGFLVATKTIFRFGDLTNNKDMKLTEYMMLGTLLSYAIALFIGWNTMILYKIL